MPLLIAEVLGISDDKELFPLTFIYKFHGGCYSHFCVVSDSHRISAHVIITLTNKLFTFAIFLYPTSGFFDLVFLAFLHLNSKDHYHSDHTHFLTFYFRKALRSMDT